MKNLSGIGLISILINLNALGAPPDLQEVSDRMQIEDTLTTLYMKTDEKDWKAVQSVFASKVAFDMSSLSHEKPATLTPGEITSIWEKGLKEITAIHHQAGNFQFKIHKDSADVHCYGIAFHYKPNPTHHDTRTFVGSYDFHLTRQAGDWKIDSFRYNSQFIDGNLNL